MVAPEKRNAGIEGAASGIVACPSSAAGESAGPGMPMNCQAFQGCPKLKLYPKSTHVTRTAAKA